MKNPVACRVYDLITRNFEHVMSMDPDHEVYVDHRNVRKKYRELRDDSFSFARGLLKLGMRRGDHLALWLPNRYEWLVVELACALIGVSVVNLNTRYKEEELSYILKDSDARALVFQDHLLGMNFTNIIEKLIPEITWHPRPSFIKSEQYPALRFCIGIGSQLPSSVIPFQTVMDDGATDPFESDAFEQVTVRDVMNLFYTSGTTSFPKGVMQTQESLLRHSHDAFLNWNVTCHDRVLVVPPFSGITGFNLLMGTLTHGATLITMDVFDVESCLKLIEREKVTMLVGFDSMLHPMLTSGIMEKYDLSSLKKGGAAVMERPLQQALAFYEQKLKFPMVTPYGLSEANALLLVASPEDPFDKRTKYPGGRLLGADKEVKLVSLADGTPVKPGEIGEICTKGYHVMKGYYKAAEATAAAIDSEGWLHTGDLGIQMDDCIYYLGRMKDSLKVRGFTFSPAEVEEVLNRHPKVEMVQVVGIPLGPGEDYVVACIKTKDAHDRPSPDEFIAYCREKMASYKAPKQVLFVDTFPTTTTGQAGNKIKKNELRKWVETQINIEEIQR